MASPLNHGRGRSSVLGWLVALLLLAAAAPAAAAVSDTESNTALTARLVTAENGVAGAATSISGGLHLKMHDGWKTYWRSPGEVGLPPKIDWEASENIEAVDFMWPAPNRFRAFGIENFGYAEEVLFPLRIMLREPGAPASLRGAVELLVCSDICVPQQFELALTLPRSEGIDDASAALIADWAAKVPEDTQGAGIEPGVAHVDNDATALTVTARSTKPFTAPDVFAELEPSAALGPPDIRLGEGGRLLWARLPIRSAGDEDPSSLRLTVTDADRAASFDAPLSQAAPAAPFTLDRIVPGIGEIAWIAAVAVLGGLILNVMPCVLPVLSIKLGSAIQARDHNAAHVRRGFIVSALGVLSFMWVLAGATVLARALGLSVGWGLQFQSPVFLAAMIALLGLFAANLLGLFEITLPQSWNTRMAAAEGRKGYLGDFATGAFAAVLATPCSAPFLGTAVAFAITGRAVDIVVVFTALGLGLALPYLAVAMRPSLVHALPRPGRWMLILKAVLGVLIGLTAAWLVWVLHGVAGQRAALVVVALVGLAVVLTGQRRRLSGRALGGGLVVLLLGAVAAPALITPGERSAAPSEQAVDWQPFDRGTIAQLVSTGQIVFVDVTADWCLTCKANKALVLDRGEVAAALSSAEVTPMQADWTRSDPAISRYLESHDRFGIPFNIVYGPAAPEGIALPEILSQEGVLTALRDAGAETLARNRP